VAADETVELGKDREACAAAYPLASACCTQKLARRALLELLDTLDAPELYAPTDDHWPLIYDCLKEQIALFNDAPVPSVVTCLRALAGDQDAAYLHLPTRARGTAGVWIDFDAYIDAYSWDTDFLLDAGVFGQLTPDAKSSLGLSRVAFGVTQGLPPHPEELALQRWRGGRGTTEGQQSPDEDEHI
jgi:hypothetical protein